MKNHDPLCLSIKHPGPHGLCDCGTIRLVRADERERIARGIEAWPPPDIPATDYAPDMPWIPQEHAARIARDGGRDE